MVCSAAFKINRLARTPVWRRLFNSTQKDNITVNKITWDQLSRLLAVIISWKRIRNYEASLSPPWILSDEYAHQMKFQFHSFRIKSTRKKYIGRVQWTRDPEGWRQPPWVLPPDTFERKLRHYLDQVSL